MTKEKEEITIFTGKHIWKSPLEYHNERMFLHGRPYYQITEVDEVYYLWELDLNDPDPHEYRIRKKCDDFGPLFDEGMELNEALGKKYDSGRLYYLTGKELIEKLTSQE
jgi:hypothetical protein